ncbi:MAG: preprotein translocase subunit YajC [Streptosporangiales bacterium]
MNLEPILFIVAIVAVFYLLLIRPQQKRRKQQQQMQQSIRPGTEIVTTAGMYAKVVATEGDDALLLEVAPGVTCKYMKQAVMRVVPEGQPAAESTEPAAVGATESTEQAHESAEPAPTAAEPGAKDGESADGTRAEDKADENGTQPETSTESGPKARDRKRPFSGSSLFGSGKDDRNKSS